VEKLPPLSYILGIVYSNVYEPEDKMRLLVSHSTRAWTYTNFISLGLIISNFDSLMISVMWISFHFVLVLWHY
jgi:hypothetical protein